MKNLVVFLAATGLIGGRSLPVLGQVRLFPTVNQFQYPLGSGQIDGAVGRVVRLGRGESQFGQEIEADVSIGDNLPILGFEQPGSPFLGLTLRVTGRFSLEDPKSSLISNDWVVGLHGVVDLGRWRLVAELYHESSHLGDEYSAKFGVDRIDWTREVAAIWARRTVGRFALHLRAGYTLDDELPLGRGSAGVGGDYRLPWGSWLGGRVTPYMGIFAESQQYADWSVTTTGRAGIEIGDRGHRSLGIGFTYLNGFSSQRQFYFQRSQYVGIEVRFGW
jgi:hypothetical protein